MGDKNFRLSSNVRPERYVFRVAPDLAARKLSGKGHIELAIEAPSKTLVLHGVHLKILSASISLGNKTARADVTPDADSQTL